MKKIFTNILLIFILLGFNQAFAAVNRNAGPSHFGGMGLDLNWYCKQTYGQASVSVNVDGTVYGWRCTKANQLVGISVDNACKKHYGNTAVAKIGDQSGGGWHCILGLNLDWFCKQKYGFMSRSVQLHNDPQQWVCLRDRHRVKINMDEACRSHYTPQAHAVLGWHGDPNSWHCQL